VLSIKDSARAAQYQVPRTPETPDGAAPVVQEDACPVRARG